MKRLKIDSVPLLENFVKNESVSIEDRLTVFKQTLNSFPLFVLSIRLNENCTVIDNQEAVLAGMLNTLAEIKANSEQKFYAGFCVVYKN